MILHFSENCCPNIKSLNISSFLSLPHLLVSSTPGNYIHCIVITNCVGCVQLGIVDVYRVLVGEQGLGIILQFLFFSCVFVFRSLISSVTLFRGLAHNDCCVSFFVFCLFSLSPLTRRYWYLEIVVSVV